MLDGVTGEALMCVGVVGSFLVWLGSENQTARNKKKEWGRDVRASCVNSGCTA